MIDVAMWARALRVIPRVTKEEWDRLDLVSRWLIATRAAVLVLTFVSSAIAGLLAARDGHGSALLFAVTTCGLLLAHATNNLLNDLTDHWKGVDEGNYFRARYGPQPLSHGLLTVRQSLTYFAITGGLAIALGVWLVALRGTLALALFGAGAFFVLFYTFPLKYIGLGEVAVLAVWGPLMTGGAYFVTTGAWDWRVALASMPWALGATTVLFGKHIDKLDDDRQKRIRTMPVLLGERASRATVLAMTFAQYALVVYLVATRSLGWPALLALGAAGFLPNLWRAYRAPRPSERPAEFPEAAWPLWFVAFAFVHNRRFGLLYVLGIALDLAIHAARP